MTNQTASATPHFETPVETDDPINARILAVSEDMIQGFQTHPFRAIAEQSGVDEETVMERIRAMLAAGTVRRVRQTLLATNLAPGALVAWKVPSSGLDAAFEFMSKDDPFSGHVVIRSTDSETTGSAFRLWTTLKVPRGYSMEKHCQLLQRIVAAESFRIMPARNLFTLGVGHVRRRGLEPGSRSDEPGAVLNTTIAELNDAEWQALGPLKREFRVEEIVAEPWRARAAEAKMAYEEFENVAQRLNERGVVGRFSTFLEHVRPSVGGNRVTRYNALFHWRVPVGRELDAGKEVGRHYVLTHAYWREGGDDFGNVNIMGVAHGTDKEVLLSHKRAIDEHLEEAGIPLLYTNVFWGGRSEIKPSEILPSVYAEWCLSRGVDPAEMRADM